MTHRFHSGIAGSLAWAVFVCANLAVASRAQPQEKPDDVAKSAGAAKSAAASKSVARILRSWKAREDRTKTVHCIWDSEEVANDKPGQRRVVATSHCECWIGRDGRYRFQMTTERFAGAKGTPERKHESMAYDGRVYSSLSWGERSTLPRRGKIFDFGQRRRVGFLNPGFLNLEMTPLAWAFRPSLWASLDPEQFRLVTEDAIVNGLRYTKLLRSDKNGRRHGSFWFDPRQGDALVFWDTDPSRAAKLPASLQYQFDRANGPTLAGWTEPWYDGSDAIAKVKTFEINKEWPAEAFQIQFPPGTAVAVDDGPTQEAYVVKPDGTKRTIFNLNSISPRLRPKLSQRTNFTVEPQPLRDVINFVHQGCQIAIAMDAASFRAAKIDPSQEVEDDTPGTRLWELLTWLSAQCPRPFGIFHQNGSLLLKPL